MVNGKSAVCEIILLCVMCIPVSVSFPVAVIRHPKKRDLREDVLILSQNSWWGIQGSGILKQLIMPHPQAGGRELMDTFFICTV